MYFLLNEIGEEEQDQRWNYLQKKYGVLKYPTTKIYSPSDHEDVIYATLGAVRGLELEHDKCDILFETTALHMLEDQGVVDYKTEALSTKANFTPWNPPKRLGALAMCCLSSFLKRSGISQEISVYYKLMSLLPEFSNPMTSMTAHYIIAKSERGSLFGKLHKLLFNYFSRHSYNKSSMLTRKMKLSLL
jgi:hypothetical protein